MEHTKGKLQVNGYCYLMPVEPGCTVVVATTAHAQGLVAEQQHANAKRLVLCWNEYDSLKAKAAFFDELVEKLKKSTDMASRECRADGGNPTWGIIRNARELLAKAEQIK